MGDCGLKYIVVYKVGVIYVLRTERGYYVFLKGREFNRGFSRLWRIILIEYTRICWLFSPVTFTIYPHTIFEFY